MAKPNEITWMDKLPEMAAVKNDITGHYVIVKKGEVGYWELQEGQTADEINAMFEVTEAQARAMKAGSIFGFDNPIADPDCHAYQVYKRPGSIL